MHERIDRTIEIGPADQVRIQILRDGTWFEYEANEDGGWPVGLGDGYPGKLMAGLEVTTENDYGEIRAHLPEIASAHRLPMITTLVIRGGRFDLKVKNA